MLPAYAPEETDISAATRTNRARIERISEPWALNKTFAIAFTFAIAMLFGSWIGSGQIENLLLVAVWLTAVLIIVFVRDYWWSPPLIITAAGIGTTAFGVPLSGVELGLIVLCIAFPVKIAMKTLRKAEPEMRPGLFYWLLIGFVAVHCVVILFYSKIGGIPLKNIVKSYYQVLVPLILYGLLIRYCHVRTIHPTVRALFFINLFVFPVSAIVALKGWSFDPFEDYRIGISWLDADSALNSLKMFAPFVFIGSLAYWPAVRPGRARVLLAGMALFSLAGLAAAGGRLPLFCCILAGVFFAVARGKIWIAVPFVICAALVSAIITSRPDVFDSLPPLMQRSLSPLNFSISGDDSEDATTGSNEWHKALRDQSLEYWFYDTNSFWLGHGFKSWDPTIPKDADMGEIDIQHRVELAIEMGLTENMFSSITNIFGVAGLVLYSLFLGQMTFLLFKGCRLAPVGTEARALCEFSLVNILSAIVLAPFMGIAPGMEMIYWTLGILAARPYLAQLKAVKPAAEEPAPEIPAFARPAFAEQAASAPGRPRQGRV